MTGELALLQIADSAFPTGGFAHSGGLEAAVAARARRRTARISTRSSASTLWQRGHGVAALRAARARRARATSGELDALCRRVRSRATSPTARAARRAARFVATCARVFDDAGRRALDDARARARRLRAPRARLRRRRSRRSASTAREALRAPSLHGAARRRLGRRAPRARRPARGAAPAARPRAARSTRCSRACADLAPDEAAQTAPLLDLVRRHARPPLRAAVSELRYTMADEHDDHEHDDHGHASPRPRAHARVVDASRAVPRSRAAPRDATTRSARSPSASAVRSAAARPRSCSRSAARCAIACSLGVVTNDIFTREDAEFLHRNEALPAERIRAVETGGCPHAAIREDISHNLDALEQLMVDVAPRAALRRERRRQPRRAVQPRARRLHDLRHRRRRRRQGPAQGRPGHHAVATCS